jgi:c-di-GMP-binding flagellar brake protein YcgR
MPEDRLHEALPFLRPRIEEPTTIVLFVFVVLCLCIASLIGLYLWRQRRQRIELETRFSKVGTQKGLAPRQILYLLQLAWTTPMKNPLLLLNLVYVFDKIAGGRASELLHAAHQDELMEIGAIRIVLGFDRLAPDQPLRTTRQSETGWTIMVWRDETETFYPWILVDRDERALTIAPLFTADHAHFSTLACGDPLTARIWREQDTEYRFNTEVLSIEAKSLVSQLRHAETIERLQQRDFYRLDIQFDITFVVEDGISEEGEDAEENQVDPTGQYITGRVLNLSAGGLSALTEQPVPSAHKLHIDPACTQPFPLGGIQCEVMQGSGTSGSAPLQLRFEALSPERERSLVQLIYQYQSNGPNPGDTPQDRE